MPMADHSVTCNRCHAGEDGQLYTLAVYHDGESFYSYVFEESDVSGQSGENVRTTLHEKPVWFTDLWRSSDGSLFVADEEGRVHVCDDKGSRSEPVAETFLNTVWGFDQQRVYAGGDDGIVYERRADGWMALGPPLGSKILCIRGTSPTDLYASGEDSLFWHFNGADWSRIALPTTAILTGLLCLSKTDTIVCGQGGALFRGHGDRWQDLSIPGRSFFDLAHWRGRVLIAGGSDGVLELAGTEIGAIKDNIAVHKIAGIEPFLAVAGGNLAARHDGTGWFGARYA
jgi:hypothetical protein